MVTISSQNLQITHDHTKHTARVIVTCNVNFTTYEMNQIKQGLKFKAKCRLWGADSWFTGADDALYAFPSKYLPDATPAATEKIVFDVTLGENALDEDIGTDEIYAKLTVVNLYTMTSTTKKTNQVSHSF
jgi:hypothetical protein